MVELKVNLGQILVTLSVCGVSFLAHRLMIKLGKLETYFQKTDVAYAVIEKKYPAEVGLATGQFLDVKSRAASSGGD